MEYEPDIVSIFNLYPSESDNKSLIDPMMIALIIIVICLILYIFGFKI